MKAFSSLFLLLLCLPNAAALTEFTNVEWVDHPENTADRFVVRTDEGELLLQLYFVEAPHPEPQTEDQQLRAEAEARFFGIPDPEALREAGAQALQATQSQLAAPFTIHTRHAPIPGAEDEALYAFVTTARGADLAAYLVRAGHARVRGLGWDTPRGLDQQEMAAILSDAQDAAMMERAGIWARSTPARLPALRAQQRRLERESPETVPPETLIQVNVNAADVQSLQQLPGVDEVLAGRIIRGRPYRTSRDLLDVRGIGVNLLDSWEGLVTTTH